MPDRKIHNAFAITLLSQLFPEVPPNRLLAMINKVNKLIDFPAKFLGPSHRVLFHDPAQALIIAMKVKQDFRDIPLSAIYLAALAHISLDKFEYEVKRLLWRKRYASSERHRNLRKADSSRFS